VRHDRFLPWSRSRARCRAPQAVSTVDWFQPLSLWTDIWMLFPKDKSERSTAPESSFAFTSCTTALLLKVGTKPHKARMGKSQLGLSSQHGVTNTQKYLRPSAIAALQQDRSYSFHFSSTLGHPLTPLCMAFIPADTTPSLPPSAPPLPSRLPSSAYPRLWAHNPEPVPAPAGQHHHPGTSN